MVCIVCVLHETIPVQCMGKDDSCDNTLAIKIQLSIYGTHLLMFSPGHLVPVGGDRQAVPIGHCKNKRI